jgi:putative Ca2+/H+ antiporter (TMEM165/GDT1 family)
MGSIGEKAQLALALISSEVTQQANVVFETYIGTALGNVLACAVRRCLKGDRGDWHDRRRSKAYCSLREIAK